MASGAACAALSALGGTDVKSAGEGKDTPQTSGRTLSTSRTAPRIVGAWAQFQFLPSELVSACGLLVQRYHDCRPQSCYSVVEIVWLSAAHELLQDHQALRTVFEHACTTRNAKPAKQRQRAVAASILACEALLQDEVGWGARYPEARERAMQLFAKVSNRRPRLMETYGYPALEG